MNYLLNVRLLQLLSCDFATSFYKYMKLNLKKRENVKAMTLHHGACARCTIIVCGTRNLVPVLRVLLDMRYVVKWMKRELCCVTVNNKLTHSPTE